ncbi:MAG: type VI secretion system tube protein Hcp [Phycisphaerales bacterium]|nr:MAG: type VI secretion system tube protein Hcp [Phycisphaerales bacterium]
METLGVQTRRAARIALVAGSFFFPNAAVRGQSPERTDPEVEIFMKIDGLKGPVVDRDHQGWIAVDSFNYGISHPVGAEGKADHKGLVLVKAVDKVSPLLYLRCTNGQPLDEVALEITRTASDDVAVQLFRLGQATVTSIQVSAHSGGKQATERVTLRYESIAWTYIKMDPDTGSVISEVTMQWDPTEEDGS